MCFVHFYYFWRTCYASSIIHDPIDALSSTLQLERPDSTNTCLLIFVLKKHSIEYLPQRLTSLAYMSEKGLPNWSKYHYTTYKSIFKR